jgi:hypothetical protein
MATNRGRTDVTDLDGPFRSVNHALAFAFNFTHGTLKRSGLAKMMGGPSAGTGKGLAGLDGAAQAGMVKQAMESMPPVYRHTLVARFAPMAMACSCKQPCCRGYRESAEWAGAVDWLANHVLEIGLTGNVKHYKFRRSVVGRYFGAKISFITIAGECGVNRDTASALNAKVVDYFRGRRDEAKPGVEWRARTELENILRTHGVLEAT